MSHMKSPVVVAIDIQQEYTTAGRPFYLAGIEPSLENCRRILRHARTKGWPVIHVRHLQAGAVFNPDEPHSRFVSGFEPEAGEPVVTKSRLSSYSNEEFGRLIDGCGGSELLVIGYGSPMCCLATIVAGAVFGHKFSFVHDASWARAISGSTEQDVHESATRILSIHAKLVSTAEVLGKTLEQAA